MTGKTILLDTICDSCGVVFIKRFSTDLSAKRHKHNFCSVKCKNLGGSYYKWSDERKAEYSLVVSGENNPRYGVAWTKEQKLLASSIKKKHYRDDPNLAYECGKTNRGKTIPREIVERQLETRKNNPHAYDHMRNMPNKIKVKIGTDSAERWTNPDYALNIQIKARKTMEELGYWIPREKLSDFELYRRNANWKESMINYLSEAELVKFKEIGMFDPKINKNGLVRDHILSRLIGFELNVPYQLLRHPCNCQILSFRENSAKCHIDNKLDEETKMNSLMVLIKKIIEFKKEWKEQNLCIDIIRKTYNDNLFLCGFAPLPQADSRILSDYSEG